MKQCIIQKAIINAKLEQPQLLKDLKAIKLEDQFMNKTPELRLGRTYNAIKVYSWFDRFQWDLEMLEIKHPHIHNFNNPIRNFLSLEDQKRQKF